MQHSKYLACKTTVLPWQSLPPNQTKPHINRRSPGSRGQLWTTHFAQHGLDLLYVRQVLIHAVLFLSTHFNVVPKDDRVCLKRCRFNCLKAKQRTTTDLHPHHWKVYLKHHLHWCCCSIMEMAYTMKPYTLWMRSIVFPIDRFVTRTHARNTWWKNKNNFETKIISIHLIEVFLCHLRQEFVEVGLVIVVDESIVEDSQRFVVEETSYLSGLSDDPYVRLRDSYGQSRIQYNLHSNAGTTCILACLSLY